jgi:hypothetical protein
MQPIDPAFDASWAAYERDAAALEVVLGGVNAESKPISHTLVRGHFATQHATCGHMYQGTAVAVGYARCAGAFPIISSNACSTKAGSK